MTAKGVEKRLKESLERRMTLTIDISVEDEKLLRQNGFAPVLRWTRVSRLSERVYRTREALDVVKRERVRNAQAYGRKIDSDVARRRREKKS